MMSEVASNPGYLQFADWFTFCEMLYRHKTAGTRDFSVRNKIEQIGIDPSTWDG
jgi:hypothetical protein